ncbi:MAG TPA: ATP-binding protein [Candidatus Acidoferrales bacterium]|nr:ATP-binding protein [Candidatus Acidoferrales bacterium]
MRRLDDQYESALKSYLQEGGEPALKSSYDLGRQALAEGMGVLDLVALHQQALEQLSGSCVTVEVLRRAGEFFAECISPFEMTHRAYGESNTALRHLNEALEEETRRIARALHDESGQLLAAVHIELQESMRGRGPAARKKIEKVEELLNEIEKQLRRFSHDLRPTVLDDYGLMPALQTFADRFSKRAGLPIKIEGALESRLPAKVETTLYRVAQEALNNVAKHAKATEVCIRLWRTPAALHFHIRDNGIGFDPSPAGANGKHGMGLRGMRERLTVLGGTLEIQSKLEHGTELQVSVPMEA